MNLLERLDKLDKEASSEVINSKTQDAYDFLKSYLFANWGILIEVIDVQREALMQFRCSCDEAYKTRKLTDPGCCDCNYGCSETLKHCDELLEVKDE